MIIKFILSIMSLIGVKTIDIYGTNVNENDVYFSDDKYIYKGSNPDNYIIYNNELWRILYFDKGIKIIKNESLGKFILGNFDIKKYYKNASIMTENDFLNTIGVSENEYEENISYYNKKTFIKTNGAWTKEKIYVGDNYFPDVDIYDYKFDIFPTIYLENVNALKGRGTKNIPYQVN